MLKFQPIKTGTGLAVVFALLLLLYSCASLQQFIKTPDVKLEAVTVENFSLFKQTLVPEFEITNPNPFAAHIKKIEYSLKFNSREVINDVVEQGILLKSGKTRIVKVPITIKHLDMFSSIEEFTSSSNGTYDLSGTIEIGTFNIPYRKTGVITIPKPPTISLEHIRINALSFLGAELILETSLTNTNSFPVDVNKLDYILRLGKTDFIVGSTENVPPIEKNNSSYFNIPVKIDLLKTGKAAYAELAGKKSTEYKLSGKMQFITLQAGEQSLPFRTQGTVPFSK